MTSRKITLVGVAANNSLSLLNKLKEEGFDVSSLALDTRGPELLRNIDHTLSHRLPGERACPLDTPMLIESGEFKTTTKRHRYEKLSPAKKLLIRQQRRNLK